MAQTRREIPLYINVKDRKFVISEDDGGSFRTPVVVARNEQVLFQFSLLDDASDPNYISIPSSSTWDFGVDDSYVSGHADYVTSADSDCNVAGDWLSGADPTPDSGKVSVRVNFNTTELATAMGSSVRKIMQMCLYYTPPGEDAVLAFQLPITVTGVTVEASPAAANPADTFPTSASLASNANGDGASLIGIEDSGGLITATTVEGALAELAAAGGGGGLTKQGTVTSDADAGEGLYNLDASGGAFNFTLPAATGSQKRYFLIGEDVETNAVTVAVQTSEYINGTQNGTYTVDRNKQVLLAVDVDTDHWTLQNLTESNMDSFGFFLDGGGSAIAASSTGYTTVPYDCILLGVYHVAPQQDAGSATIDFWHDVIANFPPTDADSITDASPLSISNNAGETSVSGWTTTRFKRGDVVAVNVDSCSGYTELELKFKVLKG